MGSVILSIVLILMALIAPWFISFFTSRSRNPFNLPRWLTGGISVTLFGLAILVGAGTSYIHVGADEVVTVYKKYGTSSLKQGQIIALDGEQGPQAYTMPFGFHFRPFINVLNDVHYEKIVEIPAGKYGALTARDGAPLRPDQTFADAFDSYKDENGKPIPISDLLDARTYLKAGGQRGPQTSILTPGRYPLNTYLWRVEMHDVTEVPAGHVAVIKSNAWSSVDVGNLETPRPASCEPTQKRTADGGELAVPLVPVGCIGIWDNSLTPGLYNINKAAYQVTLVDTRIQTWNYQGGYIKRTVDLTIDDKGGIVQKEGTALNIPVPKDAADSAIYLKIEGWEVAQEMRLLAQIPPRLAPFSIASVGGPKEVEDKIMTPSIRSIARNVAGSVVHAPLVCEEEQRRDADGNPIGQKPSCVKGEPILGADGRPLKKYRPTRVLDLIENRELLEEDILKLVRAEGNKAGVDVKEVRFGDPNIPPELLVSRLREQLAQQLSKAFVQEKLAQDDRVKSENARATANQQSALVQATINEQAAQYNKRSAQLVGEGEEAKLRAIAAGQKAQALVLGEDRVVDLRKFEILTERFATILDHIVKDRPEILTTAIANVGKLVPNTIVTGGDSGGLAGASAILGPYLRGVLPDTQSSAPTIPTMQRR